MNQIRLNKREINKINEILDNPLFENISYVKLTESEGCPGLGTVLTLSFDYTINEIDGTFSTEITNENDW